MNLKHPIVILIVAALLIAGLYYLMSPYQNCLRIQKAERDEWATQNADEIKAVESALKDDKERRRILICTTKNMSKFVQTLPDRTYNLSSLLDCAREEGWEKDPIVGKKKKLRWQDAPLLSTKKKKLDWADNPVWDDLLSNKLVQLKVDIKNARAELPHIRKLSLGDKRNCSEDTNW